MSPNYLHLNTKFWSANAYYLQNVTKKVSQTCFQGLFSPLKFNISSIGASSDLPMGKFELSTACGTFDWSIKAVTTSDWLIVFVFSDWLIAFIASDWLIVCAVFDWSITDGMMSDSLSSLRTDWLLIQGCESDWFIIPGSDDWSFSALCST